MLYSKLLLILKSKNVVLQLYSVDVLIMANNAAMRQTGLKLEMVSVCDYRSIMVPLLKSLMQVCLHSCEY